ncbi:phosphodiester glycosidase family protein [Streptomyces sp. NPDC003952]
MTDTFRRVPRGLIASAATLSAALLLAAPSPSGATGTEIKISDDWAQLTEDSKELAGGAEYFRFQEKAVTPGHSTRRELNIVRIDPAKGALRVESTVGASISGRESVRDQLKAGFFKDHPPLAGINGSYFLPEPPAAGVEGAKETLAFLGVSARDGVLNSISCVKARLGADGRPVHDAQGKEEPDYGNQAVVLQHGVPYIARLRASVTLSYLDKDKKDVPGGPTLTVGGINRDPGRAPCAYDKTTLNSAERTLTTLSEKWAYTTPDDIVLFHDGYGAKTPLANLDPTPAINEDDAAGVEVKVDAAGKMTTSTAVRGNQSVQKGGYVLQAIGQGATDLTKFVDAANAAGKGYTLKVTQRVEDMDLTRPVDGQTAQRPVDLDESVDIVSGIHRLMEDGEHSKEYKSCVRLYSPEGAKRDEGDYVAGDACRDSRTVLGIDKQGRTVLTTITGPRDAAPGTSDGEFMKSVAEILKSTFDVTDAINFDGGGSTTMIVQGTRQTGRTDETSDATDPVAEGERAIADSVYTGNGGIAVK